VEDREIDHYNAIRKQKKWLTGVLDAGMDYLKIPKTEKNYAIATKGYLTKDTFTRRLPGLKELQRKAKESSRFVALDRRIIGVPSSHLYLALLLQSFETIVMRYSMYLSHHNLNKRGIWFKQRNYVHDELQIETRKEHADELGDIIVKSFEQSGQKFDTFCPLTGEAKHGKTWAETH
jgi:hypothetical protein